MEQISSQKDTRTKNGSKVTLRVTLCNLLVGSVYLITGIFGHSMAAMSEGIDSITDCISSLLLLLGFQISARKPDSKHPNGHKRIEYIIGLLISEMILLAAFSLGKESILLLLHPAAVSSSLLLLLASLFGAALKLLIALYIKQQNQVLCSASLKAYYKNTLADFKGICLVAVSAILQPLTSLPIDAVAGLVLALLIGWDGLGSFFENVSLLIGEGNDVLSGGNSYANQ